jgi:hypothetical protein
LPAIINYTSNVHKHLKWLGKTPTMAGWQQSLWSQ